MEDHIGHKKKLLQTAFKEGKQELAVAIEMIDERINKLEAKEHEMERLISNVEREEPNQLESIKEFALAMDGESS